LFSRELLIRLGEGEKGRGGSGGKKHSRDGMQRREGFGRRTKLRDQKKGDGRKRATEKERGGFVVLNAPQP